MNERCPNCGRYVSHEAQGYYDTDPPKRSQEDGYELRIYCDEACRDARLRDVEDLRRHGVGHYDAN